MSMYLIEHHHTAEMCPRKNPEMVRHLARHVTQGNASKFGVKIHADWVYEPEHRMLLVLEADSPDKVMSYVQPFLQVGTLTVTPGSTCEEVAKECLT